MTEYRICKNEDDLYKVQYYARKTTGWFFKKTRWDWFDAHERTVLPHTKLFLRKNIEEVYDKIKMWKEADLRRKAKDIKLNNWIIIEEI